ncbi:MAG: hypothetical protein LBC86_10320 [Oscillospiraceae bacterium]|jgi:hypothetical protein|nr:hypothetical protein [Oscillospiraceae bacterium]
MTNIFTQVKERLELRDVTEYYGFEVDRGGFISCPFHNDKNPSMKIYDENYHCFGCGEHGDVTDFVGKLFNLEPKDAAQKIADDFGIIIENRSKTLTPQEKSEYRDFMVQSERALNLLSDYCDYLNKCYTEYMPTWENNKIETPHPLFMKALIEKDDYVLMIYATLNIMKCK